MENVTTLYLADDHKLVIDGLKLLAETIPSLRIVGTALDGQTACSEIQQKQPDIALVDLRMPGLTGLQLTMKLSAKVPTRFVILTMRTEPHYVTEARKLGAAGYLLKTTGKEDLVRCIETVKSGSVYFPSLLNATSEDRSSDLTSRELEILRMILNDYTSQQIADSLKVALFTVDTHRRNILRKTNTRTPLGLMRYALDNGIDF